MRFVSIWSLNFKFSNSGATKSLKINGYIPVTKLKLYGSIRHEIFKTEIDTNLDV